MPLHLLGKKSWNVYNTDNVERVRRDEAEAQRREEEEERRMQEVDSEARLNILRGVPPPQSARPIFTESSATEPRVPTERRSKKRKLAGEDDTDQQIRLAKVRSEDVERARSVLPKTSDLALTDKRGHIDLFPQERSRAERNEEAEKDTRKKKREYEDQYTMRFSNAAGIKEGMTNPWYSTTSQRPEHMPTKNVWGNEDPLRQEREHTRLNANDPLAFMKKGVEQLKQSEQQRAARKAERDKETSMSVISHSRRHRRYSRSRGDAEDRDGRNHRSRRHGSEDPSQHRHSSHRHRHRDREHGPHGDTSDHSRHHGHRHRLMEDRT